MTEQKELVTQDAGGLETLLNIFNIPGLVVAVGIASAASAGFALAAGRIAAAFVAEASAATPLAVGTLVAAAEKAVAACTSSGAAAVAWVAAGP